MNNYEYIIAGLPVLQPGPSHSQHTPASDIIEDIRGQLSSKDLETFDFLLSGYDDTVLDRDYYAKALAHRNRFIREFFAYDLRLRNVKVDYLNKALGRPEGQDTVQLEGVSEQEFEGRQEVLSVLEGSDILKRERGLDDLMWKTIDEITVMEVFSLNVILAFAAKLRIIDRWDRLDPETGNALFRKLVTEIRSTYDNKKNNMI